VTQLAYVCRLFVIVTCIAYSHRRHIPWSCILDFLQPLVAGLALDIQFTDVLLVGENDLPWRICKRNEVFLIRMAVCAIVFYLILMTCGAFRLLGQEIV
jgi:hypothetical protein